jgi:hypothetical protein
MIGQYNKVLPYSYSSIEILKRVVHLSLHDTPQLLGYELQSSELQQAVQLPFALEAFVVA